MLRTHSELARWLGPLAVAALVAASATPIHATETLQVVAKNPAPGTAAAAIQNQSADRIEAADTKAARATNDFDDATIRLNGVVVMRLQASSHGLSAMQRAHIVQERLDRASAGLDYASINSVTMDNVAASSLVNVVEARGESVVYLRGEQLVTVTRADAAANGSNSTTGLARTWAQNLRDGAEAIHLRGARNRADEARATPRPGEPSPSTVSTSTYATKSATTATSPVR